MAGLQGNTDGVGKDIVQFLDAIAKYFNATLVITSGFRSPSQQAAAMYKNWIKLQRGAVYNKQTLPETERRRLDTLYRASKDGKASPPARQRARTSFLKRAIEQVGDKSMHSKGRAVDMTQASVPAVVFRAITTRMARVPEGNRNDIYHFESSVPIPEVTDGDRQAWHAMAGGNKTHVTA